jgi:hypothetical protein
VRYGQVWTLGYTVMVSIAIYRLRNRQKVEICRVVSILLRNRVSRLTHQQHWQEVLSAENALQVSELKLEALQRKDALLQQVQETASSMTGQSYLYKSISPRRKLVTATSPRRDVYGPVRPVIHREAIRNWPRVSDASDWQDAVVIA